MSTFIYEGRTQDGQMRSGEREAASEDALNQNLLQEGIIPITIREKKANTIKTVEHIFQDLLGNRVKKAEISTLMRQLQLLTHANVPILSALSLLGQYVRNPVLKDAMQGICQNLEKGQPLAVAMSQYPKLFNKMIIRMIEIGERTGHLSDAFGQLYEYLEFEMSSEKKVRAALRYPMILLVSVLGTLLVMNIFVIPTFAKVYAQLHSDLPWQTAILIQMSHFITHQGPYALILVMLGFFAFKKYIRTPSGESKYHRALLNLPIFGKLLKRIILIRFAKTLSTVLSAGVPLIDGLYFSKDVIANAHVASQIKTACELIERGAPFVSAIQEIAIFSPLELQMLVVGDQNGQLSPSLKYIHEFHSSEIEYELKRVNDLLGPILVAVFSGIILLVALGIYLPLWNITTTMR
jgi:MSHA biogenesis protein MshG